MQRLWAHWSAYWLAPGGRQATAAVRIALAVSLLWMLDHYASNLDSTQSALYHRVGIWMLYPARPGAELLHVITIVAWVSTLAMLVGAFSRVSHAVSLVATMAIAAHGVSDSPGWSHTDVPPILASFAFLGARGGDAWSIDAWLRRRRGQPAPAAHQGSVRLVLLAVVSVFFIAGYCKLRADGFGLGWALSDNLRHQLLMRFDWIHAERTPAAEWLMAESWRYQLVAMLNLISQITPIAALFLFRFPILRSCLAVLFVSEVLGLGIVMDMWNLHWLPLAAVFVDWDALTGWVLRRRRATDEAPTGSPRGRWFVAFATAFIVFFALQAFWLDQRLRAFPFSSFPMFGIVRAKQPYDQHQSYEVLGGHIEAEGARPLTAAEQAWISQRGTYRWMWRARKPEAIRDNLRAILDETRQAFPDAAITRVRISLAVFQAPAYPAPARFERHDLAVLGELELDGTFRTAVGGLGADLATVATTPETIELAGAQPFAIRGLLPEPHRLEATATATGFVLATPLRGDPEYLVVLPRGDSRRWLVGQRSRRAF